MKIANIEAPCVGVFASLVTAIDICLLQRKFALTGWNAMTFSTLLKPFGATKPPRIRQNLFLSQYFQHGAKKLLSTIASCT
jgi:hypothetical protein